MKASKIKQKNTDKATNRSKKLVRSEASIVSQFEKTVDKFPHLIAIKIQGECLTYDQLNRQANHIAHLMLEKGKVSKSGNILDSGVAILFDRNPNLFSSIIGVLKAGSFFVCLNLAYPEERLKSIIDDSGVKIIITDSKHKNLAKNLLGNGSKDEKTVINLDEIGLMVDQENVNMNISSDDDAFLIYTSGTTGTPKGVMHAHKNIIFCDQRMSGYFNYCHEDTFTYFQHPSFIAGIFNMFNAFFNGGTLLVLSAADKDLKHIICQNNVTIWQYVPSVFRYFVSLLDEKERVGSVRVVILGSAPLGKKDFKLFKRHFSSRCLFANRLGCSEFPLATIHIMSKSSQINGEIVPVGKPLDGVKIEIKDESRGKATAGELILKSKYYSCRYWNQPLNKQDKLSVLSQGKGTIFRTGDIVRINRDDDIEYLGRNDFQIKMDGHRIELEEIEINVLQHERVKECAAVVKKDAGGKNYVVVFYVSKRNINPEAVRSFLMKKMPIFMIPRHFVALKDLPLTSNGKVDRKAIGKIEIKNEKKISRSAKYSKTEKVLIGMWKNIFGDGAIDKDDNFFNSGGDSLGIIKLYSRIDSSYPGKIKISDIFSYPTIYKLAKIIDEKRNIK